MQKMIYYFSPKGYPLAYWRNNTDTKRDYDILTVGLFDKWHELYLIKPNDKICTVSFNVLERYCKQNESPFSDHVPNPQVVARYCEDNGIYLDTIAEEIIIGRWEIEYKRNYRL